MSDLAQVRAVLADGAPEMPTPGQGLDIARLISGMSHQAELSELVRSDRHLVERGLFIRDRARIWCAHALARADGWSKPATDRLVRRIDRAGVAMALISVHRDRQDGRPSGVRELRRLLASLIPCHRSWTLMRVVAVAAMPPGEPWQWQMDAQRRGAQQALAAVATPDDLVQVLQGSDAELALLGAWVGSAYEEAPAPPAAMRHFAAVSLASWPCSAVAE